ncbi:MAG: hypothetical protein QM765_10015 [Myxococcales bacterium]
MSHLTRWSLGFVLASLCACGQETVASGPDASPPPEKDGASAHDAGFAAIEDASTAWVDASADGVDAATRPDAAAPCVDTCPMPTGVAWECKKRFALGTNWAWRNFGADFGGITSWGQDGVSKDPDGFDADLTQIAGKGVNVIRWWMFPRFFSDSISFDADGVPSGIGGTLKADIEKALELAEAHDVYLMLTLFSFDTFTPTKDEYGLHIPGLAPIVKDPAKSAKLYANLVAPVAKAVEASPYRRRMIAWDLINEPEWAMTGPSLYGDPAFEANGELEPVTHPQMETFLKGLAAEIRKHSTAQLTIGSAAIKWAKAWTGVGVDFYQLHYYGWVYEWFPYMTVTPAKAGLTGKPVVMGEFPNAGLAAIPAKGYPAKTASQFAADLWTVGYGGALSWAYSDTSFPWSSLDLKTFGNQHTCQTQF